MICCRTFRTKSSPFAHIFDADPHVVQLLTDQEHEVTTFDNLPNQIMSRKIRANE